MVVKQKDVLSMDALSMLKKVVSALRMALRCKEKGALSMDALTEREKRVSAGLTELN
jgi:hypothetical protein